MFVFSFTGFAQSGQKWATGGNSVSGGDFMGTTNNYPLLFKANNNLIFSLKTNGDVIIHPFAGSDSGLVAYNSAGKLIPFKIPNNDKYVLLGNGTWGPLPIPANYWKLDNANNHLYTLTTGNVGIGTQTPVMKLDVNGDAIVRGYLYVDNGVIIGKRIESKSVDSDTLRVNETVNTKELFSRQTYSDSLTAVKVETENLNASKAAAIGTTIIIDGPGSSIISAAGKIDFGNNELRTTGPITGGAFNIGTGNFATLNVTNRINIGANTLILENDPGGFHNSIYTHGTAQNEDLFIQSTTLNNNNTIINYNNGGKVGIGTNSPDEKLHVRGPNDYFVGAKFENDEGYLKIGFNGAHGIIDSDKEILMNWNSGKDVIIGGGGSYWNLPEQGNLIALHDAIVKRNLFVGAKIFANEIEVMASVPFPDYVFNDNYKIMSISELQNYISENKKLPGVPSAKEVKDNGMELGALNIVLLEKIEELTLYIISLNNQIEKLEKSIEINKIEE